MVGGHVVSGVRTVIDVARVTCGMSARGARYRTPGGCGLKAVSACSKTPTRFGGPPTEGIEHFEFPAH